MQKEINNPTDHIWYENLTFPVLSLTKQGNFLHVIIALTLFLLFPVCWVQVLDWLYRISYPVNTMTTSQLIASGPQELMGANTGPELMAYNQEAFIRTPFTAGAQVDSFLTIPVPSKFCTFASPILLLLCCPPSYLCTQTYLSFSAWPASHLYYETFFDYFLISLFCKSKHLLSILQIWCSYCPMLFDIYCYLNLN